MIVGFSIANAAKAPAKITCTGLDPVRSALVLLDFKGGLRETVGKIGEAEVYLTADYPTGWMAIEVNNSNRKIFKTQGYKNIWLDYLNWDTSEWISVGCSLK